MQKAAEKSRQQRISRLRGLRAEVKSLRRQKKEMVQQKEDLMMQIKQVKQEIVVNNDKCQEFTLFHVIIISIFPQILHSRRSLRRALELESSSYCEFNEESSY